MNCDEARRSLQDYVTRELSPENRRLFDAHLVECEECQRELALMTALVSTLDHQPVLEPSPGFGEKVLASLPRQRSLVLSPWWSLALAPLLAGVVWLARVPIERGLDGLLSRVSAGQLSAPAVTLSQAGIAALAVVLVGVAVAFGAGAYAWQVYLRD